MNQREQIQMTDAEVEEFLHGRHTMSIATISKDGQPHLVAMWYGFLDGKPAFWTYGKSQKVMNLQRDNRITCLIEDGKTYNELRGVSLIGKAKIYEDEETRMRLAKNVYERYNGTVNDQVRAVLRKMGDKRVVVQIEVEKVISWDHRKIKVSNH